MPSTRPMKICVVTDGMWDPALAGFNPGFDKSSLITKRPAGRLYSRLAGPQLSNAAGAPPPPRLLGDFAPHNSSRLSLAGAAGLEHSLLARAAGADVLRDRADDRLLLLGRQL